MRRVLRLVVGVAAVAGTVWFLMQSSGAQIPPLPSFPSFTLPSFPSIPTTTPPPTMPPPTTTPPPTMPPPTTATTTPPPTMPPTTIGRPDIDAEIENLIDRLEQFGDVFAEIIEELQALQARF